MITPSPDSRPADRQALDELIANEPPLPPPNLPADATSVPLEKHLSGPQKRPVAVAGIVENGLVRPIDPNVQLPEHARVIIVATESR
jgi:hypothetical protein